MKAQRQCGPGRGARRGAFTLIEIIIAMTIIAVIAAVAVPTLKGLNEEEKVRAPLTTFAEMVQEVRRRSIHERRQYEILFERGGIHAIPGSQSFVRRDEFLKRLEELRTPPEVTEFERPQPEKTEIARNEAALPSGPKALPDKPSDTSKSPETQSGPELPWTQTLPLEDGMKAAVLLWGDGEWDPLDGDRLRRWVFQANGMASPLRVRLTAGGMELEAGFDLLTGELTDEKSRSASEARP